MRNLRSGDCHAAVDDDGLAGDEAAAVGCQPHQRRGELSWIAPAAQQHSRFEAFDITWPLGVGHCDSKNPGAIALTRMPLRDAHC